MSCILQFIKRERKTDRIRSYFGERGEDRIRGWRVSAQVRPCALKAPDVDTIGVDTIASFLTGEPHGHTPESIALGTVFRIDKSVNCRSPGTSGCNPSEI